MKPYWNIEEIKKLDFEFPNNPTRGFNFIDPQDEHRYNSVNAGLYHGLPTCLISEELETKFNWLTNKSYAVTKMLPGNVLPTHYDKYSFYNKTHNVKIEHICRVILFLDDWKLGHFLQIKDKDVPNWKAGDWAYWIGSTPHIAGNIGLLDRYVLQITGIYYG
jgi:hypothetical protein